MPFNQRPIQTVQPIRRLLHPIIRPPMARVLHPLSALPKTSAVDDNKKKLISILRSFLNRCSTTPEANLPQMIIITEVS